MGINEGAFGPAALKWDRNQFALPCKGPGLPPERWIQEQLCRLSRPLRRHDDLIPFSMTLGLLPILARIVADLVLKTVLLLIAVVSMPLGGRFGHRRVLPLFCGFSTTGGWVWASKQISRTACGHERRCRWASLA